MLDRVEGMSKIKFNVGESRESEKVELWQMRERK